MDIFNPMWWDILLIFTVFLAANGLLYLYIRRAYDIPRLWFWAMVCLKTGTGLFLVESYRGLESREDADVFKYYDDGQHISQKGANTSSYEHWSFILGLAKPNPDQRSALEHTHHWYRPSMESLPNDNRVMIRTHAVLHQITGGNIHLHAVFFSLLASLGLFWVFFAFRKGTSEDGCFFLLLLATPTLLLWTSAPLKESLLILGLGATLLAGRKFKENSSTSATALLLLGGVLLATMKPYVGLAMGLGLLLYLIGFSRKNVLRISCVTGIAAIAVLLSPMGDELALRIHNKQLDFARISRAGIYLTDGDARYFIANERMDAVEQISDDSARILHPVQVLRIDMADNSERSLELGLSEPMAIHLVTRGANSFIGTRELGSGTQLMRAAPVALLYAITSPVGSMTQDPYRLLFGAEQLVLLIFVCAGLWLGRKKVTGKELSLILSAICLLLLLGYTVPVEGALVRYRLPVILLFLCIVHNTTGWRLSTWFSKRR